MAAAANEVGQVLGVSPNAVLGSVAEEFNSRISSNLFSNLGPVVQGLADLTSRVYSHVELAQNYEQSLSFSSEQLLSRSWLFKYQNPVLIDVGPGNISIRTAITLLRNYLQDNPSSDPLNLRRYENNYDLLTKYLNDIYSSTTISISGLMAREAQSFYENRASAAWEQASQTERDALTVVYYKRGLEVMTGLADAADASGVEFRPAISHGGQRHTANADLIEEARQRGLLGNNPAPRCFLAGTPILMADGQEKPIEDIRVGDMVMSFDPSADQGRGALVPKPVSRTFQNITRSIIDLRGLHMTPGHVCLTDDGRFETIAEILLRDGILVEADGTPIRARTGAKLGSMEDIPVLIAYPDEKTGKEIFVRARAGIPCCLMRERDGTMCHRSLALMLRAYHQTLTPDGLILSPDGSLGEATDWPEDSTPMDADYRRNWVIQSADGKPYVPEWILEVASEAREEQTVGATLQRIISPPSQRFAPKVVDNPTPPARNRAERRGQKHRGPK